MRPCWKRPSHVACVAGSAPLRSGATSPSARLLFSAAAWRSLQPGPRAGCLAAHALLPSPPLLTPLLPLFPFIHPVPFLFLEEREMLGELRYLAGIRCELGKTALALAPVPGPLGRPPKCGPPDVASPGAGCPEAGPGQRFPTSPGSVWTFVS